MNPEILDTTSYSQNSYIPEKASGLRLRAPPLYGHRTRHSVWFRPSHSVAGLARGACGIGTDRKVDRRSGTVSFATTIKGRRCGPIPGNEVGRGNGERANRRLELQLKDRPVREQE